MIVPSNFTTDDVVTRSQRRLQVQILGDACFRSNTLDFSLCL
jgi:hypothetical protein